MNPTSIGLITIAGQEYKAPLPVVTHILELRDELDNVKACGREVSQHWKDARKERDDLRTQLATTEAALRQSELYSWFLEDQLDEFGLKAAQKKLAAATQQKQPTP